MSYISASDMSCAITDTELIQLTDDSGSGVVDTARINEVIGMAAALVDSYIGGRYKVPLSAPIPEVVKAASVSIAVYLLNMRSSFEISDKRVKAYEQAISLLKDIARGTATLGIEETTQERDNAASNKAANSRIFTSGSMRGV
ncbi:MAG: DUF1320 domain-containing protein [Candidatus Magnetominusculus sp. LBB02]|nr:DUF1320 domain-containing protein [Candidatus Magnetominusculus sp. LBB02]